MPREGAYFPDYRAERPDRSRRYVPQPSGYESVHPEFDARNYIGNASRMDGRGPMRERDPMAMRDRDRLAEQQLLRSGRDGHIPRDTMGRQPGMPPDRYAEAPARHSARRERHKDKKKKKSKHRRDGHSEERRRKAKNKPEPLVAYSDVSSDSDVYNSDERGATHSPVQSRVSPQSSRNKREFSPKTALEQYKHIKSNSNSPHIEYRERTPPRNLSSHKSRSKSSKGMYGEPTTSAPKAYPKAYDGMQGKYTRRTPLESPSPKRPRHHSRSRSPSPTRAKHRDRTGRSYSRSPIGGNFSHRQSRSTSRGRSYSNRLSLSPTSPTQPYGTAVNPPRKVRSDLPGNTLGSELDKLKKARDRKAVRNRVAEAAGIPPESQGVATPPQTTVISKHESDNSSRTSEETAHPSPHKDSSGRSSHKPRNSSKHDVLNVKQSRGDSGPDVIIDVDALDDASQSKSKSKRREAERQKREAEKLKEQQTVAEEVKLSKADIPDIASPTPTPTSGNFPPEPEPLKLAPHQLDALRERERREKEREQIKKKKVPTATLR